MKTQIAIIGTSLGNELEPPAGEWPSAKGGPTPGVTESPLHVLSGDNDPPAFYAVAVTGSSPTPAFNIYQCTEPPSFDLVTDLTNMFNYCFTHTWTVSVSGSGFYSQTDTIDGGTFSPATAAINQDTFPNGFNGQDDNGNPNPPFWNNQIGNSYNPNGPDDPNGGFTSAGTSPFDKGPTREALTDAVMNTDMASIWNGDRSVPINIFYDRASVSDLTSQPLPFAQGFSGQLKFGTGNTGPFFVGNAGQLVVLAESEQADGIFVTRVQIQVRNLGLVAIEYFICEMFGIYTNIDNDIKQFPFNRAVAYGGGGAGGTIQPESVIPAFRLISTGFWKTENQIVELPLPAMDGPQPLSVPAGSGVRVGSQVFMVVGQTFTEFMQQSAGPNWRNFIIS